jgi:transcriptional regulator with XRE-family HTH domain
MLKYNKNTKPNLEFSQPKCKIMKIHEKISSLRRLKKISQQKMAEKLGLTVNGYADIEYGKVSVTTDRLEEIANAMDVDIYELFNFGEKNVIFLSIENSPFGSNYFIGHNINLSKETDFEIQRLQLMLEHSQEMLAQKDKEIETLREVNALLKKNA